MYIIIWLVGITSHGLLEIKPAYKDLSLTSITNTTLHNGRVDGRSPKISKPTAIFFCVA
jgi:hypothetical protein